MSQQKPFVTQMNSQVAEQYLINAADGLAGKVMPYLEGSAKDRAKEIIDIITRVGSQLNGPVIDQEGGEPGILDKEEQKITELRDQLGQAAADTSRSFDPDRLQHYLQQHELGSPGLKIIDHKVLEGGRSKQTVLITQQGCETLPAELILRQDWASSVTGASVVPEFEVLKRVAAAGMKVPTPILLEEGSEATGAPFIIVERVRGRSIGEIHTPPTGKVTLEIAEQLGKLHALSSADFEGLPGIVTKAYGQDQLEQELAEYKAQYDQLCDVSETGDGVIAWMEQQIPNIEGPQCLVHIDIGLHNLLVDDNELTAVLDWELAHIGHPAEDLGYCRTTMSKAVPWERFMDAYHEAGGREFSGLSLDFYTLWGSFRLYVLLNQARAAIASGQVRDQEMTWACCEYMPRVLQQLSLEFRQVTGS